MATIPIFDGAGGNEEASIRPTRIGPEEPRSPVGEAVSNSMKEITAVSKQMSYLKDGNDLNAGNLAITNHLNAVKTQLESQPLSQFTTPEAYQAQAKQMSDPTKLLQSFSGMSPHVRKMLAGNAQRLQDDFLNTQASNSIVLGHHKGLSDMETNLTGFAQAYGQADPDHAALYKKLGSDSIDHTVALGAMTPGEGAIRKQKFENQLDVSSLHNLTIENPAAAGSLLTGEGWKQQYPTITQEQRQAALSNAHSNLTQTLNASNEVLKTQTSQVEAEFLRRQHNGTLTQGWADQQVQSYPELRNYFTAAFGKKPPSEGNSEAYFGLMTQLNSPNLDKNAIDQIRIQAAGSGMNAEQSKQFNIAAMGRENGLHSPLNLARDNAKNQWAQQQIAWERTLPPNADQIYNMSHGIMRGSKVNLFRDIIEGEKANFNNAMENANSPAEVAKVIKEYGNIGDHLPSLNDGSGPSKTNKSGYPAIPPPANLAPADAAKKYTNLGKIKIPGA